VPVPKQIISLPVENELHVCPDCGYTLGFHTSFVSTGTSRDNPVRSTREVWRVILICPECGARYDVGWRVSFIQVNSPTCSPHGNPASCLPVRPPHDQHLPE
jgi:hypothetical protein